MKSNVTKATIAEQRCKIDILQMQTNVLCFLSNIHTQNAKYTIAVIYVKPLSRQKTVNVIKMLFIGMTQ